LLDFKQKEKDAVRALAELAMEVEELATNEASAKAIIHRVRARTKLAALEPIGGAGEATTFDRRRHESVGRSVTDGSAVVVVRPGYIWKGEVLLARAVVQDRT
jgi:molecular chaperone GrpE (heat shock protein)